MTAAVARGYAVLANVDAKRLSAALKGRPAQTRREWIG